MDFVVVARPPVSPNSRIHIQWQPFMTRTSVRMAAAKRLDTAKRLHAAKDAGEDVQQRICTIQGTPQRLVAGGWCWVLTSPVPSTTQPGKVSGSGS